MLLAAGRARSLRGVRYPPHQLLELGSAVLAKVFVNWHRVLLHYKGTDPVHDDAHGGGGSVVVVYQHGERHPAAIRPFGITRKRADVGERTRLRVDSPGRGTVPETGGESAVLSAHRQH